MKKEKKAPIGSQEPENIAVTEQKSKKKKSVQTGKKKPNEITTMNGSDDAVSPSKGQPKQPSSTQEGNVFNADGTQVDAGFAQVVAVDGSNEASNDHTQTDDLPVAVLSDEATNHGVITVMVRVPPPGQTLGLVLRRMNQRIFVAEIKPHSAYNGTALQVGQKVAFINGVECFDKTVDEAVALLRPVDQPTTTLTVQANPSIISVQFGEDATFSVTVKKEPNKPIGVRFKDVNGQIYISGIVPAGPFGQIDLLKEGYKVLRINDGEPVSCSDALSLVNLCQGQTCLMVEPPTDVTPIHTAVVTPTHSAYPPPRGAPGGGVWGRDEFIGNNSKTIMSVGVIASAASCLLFGGFGLICCCMVCGPCCCPCDGRELYYVNGMYYTKSGARVPGQEVSRFKPHGTS